MDKEWRCLLNLRSRLGFFGWNCKMVSNLASSLYREPDMLISCVLCSCFALRVFRCTINMYLSSPLGLTSAQSAKTIGLLLELL